MLLLWGCTTTPSSQETLWGDLLLIAQVPQTAAPALVLDGDSLTAVWIGSDERGVHHDARRISQDGVLGNLLTLPLPPRYPHALQLTKGIGDRDHLLWLDADEDGEIRLYSAILDLNLSVFRGPILVSDAQTFRYSAVEDGAGGVLVAWSSRLPDEPTLTITRIDYEGRPVQQLEQLDAADYPTLFRSVDGIYLSWLDVNAQVMCLSRFQLGITPICQSRLPTVSIGRGDLLQGLTVGADRTHIYLFWNIQRAQSGDETWFATLPIGGDVWSQPQRLSFTTVAAATMQTSYNSGQVSAAQLGGEAHFAFAALLPTIGDTLPVAGQSGDELAMLYFADGGVVGYQAITRARLLAPPLLLSDQDRHLYLAWSNAVSTDHADLHLTSTR